MHCHLLVTVQSTPPLKYILQGDEGTSEGKFYTDTLLFESTSKYYINMFESLSITAEFIYEQKKCLFHFVETMFKGIKS